MKKCSKAAYDQRVRPHTFHEGDLVLAYHIAKSKIGLGKFKPHWHDPFIIWKCLPKGTYVVAFPEGNLLDNPVNGLYLKKFYPWACSAMTMYSTT